MECLHIPQFMGLYIQELNDKVVEKGELDTEKYANCEHGYTQQSEVSGPMPEWIVESHCFLNW